MLFSLGIVLFLLIRAIAKKKAKHTIAFSIWVLIVFWFFNSAFFGFSQVSITPGGIHLKYGILSFKKNTQLPIDSPWKIETSFSGIRKMKKLYYMKIAERKSMKVSGAGGYHLLQTIAGTLDNLNRK
jgi:hypothetical protein